MSQSYTTYHIRGPGNIVVRSLDWDRLHHVFYHVFLRCLSVLRYPPKLLIWRRNSNWGKMEDRVETRLPPEMFDGWHTTSPKLILNTIYPIILNFRVWIRIDRKWPKCTMIHSLWMDYVMELKDALEVLSCINELSQFVALNEPQCGSQE